MNNALGNKQFMAQNIKRFMAQKGISRQDFCVALNLNYSTVTDWLNAKKYPRIDKIELMANYFNVSKSDLVEEYKPKVTPTPVSTYPYIPESVAAGLPTNINAMTTLPYISVPDVLMGRYAGAKGIIFMRVNGESMNKVIPNQAYIAIDTRITLHDLKDGNIVVFVDEFDGYSVKRFFRMQNRLVFRPESDNHDYFDLAFKETDNIRIVGRVVTYIVNLE